MVSTHGKAEDPDLVNPEQQGDAAEKALQPANPPQAQIQFQLPPAPQQAAVNS